MSEAPTRWFQPITKTSNQSRETCVKRRLTSISELIDSDDFGRSGISRGLGGEDSARFRGVFQRKTHPRAGLHQPREVARSDRGG